MFDLFRSEWRRFRRLTLVVLSVHALALFTLSRAVDVAQLGYEDHLVLLVVYLLLGLGLAVMQVGSYRQPSRWLWLVHRPLAPARIFGALALAALAQVALAIAAPLLALVLLTDAFTSQVIDVRHYLAVLHVLAFTMLAWLAGAHACTARNRLVVLVLLAPLLLGVGLASGWALLPIVLAWVLWLALVAGAGFRADRRAPIRNHGILLLTALPLQLAFFLLAYQASRAGVEFVRMLASGSPGQTVLEGDPDVDVEAMVHSMGVRFMARGLEQSTDPRAASWREQLPLLEMAGVAPDIERFPVRHQLSNVGQPWWDPERGTLWTFSHDRMQYLGRDPLKGDAAGWWGTGGAAAGGRYDHVPLVAMTRDTLYAVDQELQRQRAIVQLPPGEWFLSRPAHALDHRLLLTNRRLLAYRSDRSDASPLAPPDLAWEVPLSQRQPVVDVSMAELLDGWLVSVFYDDRPDYPGFERWRDPWQQVIHVAADGRTTVVGERHGIHDFTVSRGGPALLPPASWWLSPLLYGIARLPDALLDAGRTRPPGPWLPALRQLVPIALVLLVLSLLGALAWMRGTRATPARRAFWLASCGLLGVPALLSMVCLEPRIPRG